MTFRHIAEETLVDYTLGYLEGRAKVDVEQHLFTCDYCLSEWRSWQLILNNVAEEEKCKPKLQKNVLNRIHEHEQRKKHLKMWKPAYAVMSFCIVMIVLITMNMGSHGSQLADQTDEPIDQQHLIEVMEVNSSQSQMITTIPEMIWIHDHEYRPIVRVTHHEFPQLMDCQYIVVSRKQHVDVQSNLTWLQHTPLSQHDEADIYFKCVK